MVLNHKCLIKSWKMVRCRYYSMGSCRYGERCRFEHAPLSVQAQTFVPTNPCVKTGVQNATDLSRSTPTQPLEDANNDQPGVPTDTVTNTIITQPTETVTTSTLVRKYGTSSVSFGPGANVQELKLSNDTSGVQLRHLPLSTTFQTVLDLVAASKFDPDKVFSVKVFDASSGSVSEKTAVIAVDNVANARQLHVDLKQQLKETGYSNVVCQLTSLDGKSASLKVPYLSCKWFKPSKVAYLHYRGSIAACEASKYLHQSVVNGRRVTAEYQVPPSFVSRMIFTVRLGNLELTTNRSHIWNVVCGTPGTHMPADVIFGPSSSPLDDEPAADVVKKMLEKYEPLQMWDLDLHSNPKWCRALARFGSSQKSLLAQSELNEKKIPQLGCSPLFISVVHVLKFPVLSNIYAADREDINKFLNGLKDMTYKIYHGDGQAKYVTIRLQSSERETALRAKQDLEQIVNGEIAEHLQKTIWHSWFASPPGLAFVNSLAKEQGGYVYCDVRNELLKLHGTKLEKVALRHNLAEKLKALLGSIFHIPLPTDFLRYAIIIQQYRKVIATLGESHARLDITMRPPTLIIEGNKEQHQQALRIMACDDAKDSAQKPCDTWKESDSMCVICWDQDNEETIELACGHSYCKDCFHMQCLSNTRDGKPIECSGNNATCNVVPEINELSTHLQPSELDGVLVAAFQAYVQQHPKEVRNCPTPDCKSVFRVTTTPQSSTCTACLGDCCTSCFDAAHDDKSCEAQKQEQASDKQYEEWKKQSGIRDCPICNAAIEKSGGCSHMECLACRAHICWMCMATFKTGPETYDHLVENHGGIFDLAALDLS